MAIISNMRIGIRLAIGFCLVLCCAIGLLALGLMRMSEMQASTDHIVKEAVAGFSDATAMREGGLSVAFALRKLVTAADAGEIERDNKKLLQVMENYGKSEQRLRSVLAGAQGKTLLATVDEQKRAIFAAVEKIQKDVMEGKFFGGADQLEADFMPQHDKWMESLNALAEHQMQNMQSTYAESRESYQSAQIGMLIVGVVTVILGSLVSWMITRSITIPLKDAAHIADTIAGGDLTAVIEVKTRDEAGQLVNAMKRMQDNLVETVTRIKQGAEIIAYASREIAAGNADLSSRTEVQASSLEETAGSMEELTGTVRQNAEHAQHADQLVNSASTVAAKGGEVVGKVVHTMGSITESARRIVDIISVIDGIAFQTNILALNAAVEAARAGEQGRGFAVVAAEVRNLAQRSASAAKEIKALIGDSVEKVSLGSKLVDEAGIAMDEIVASVKQVATIMGEITAASQEQSAGIEEVNRAIERMDEMTQQNASLVEQAATTAESMREQATLLAQTVNVFRVDSLQRGPAREIPLLNYQ